MKVLAVDTSAIVAIIKSEPDWESLATCLQKSSSRLLSAASWVELSLVIAGRQGDAASLEAIDRFLRAVSIDICPVDEAQARIARTAFLRFGKGRHPACLNFGDCFSYALARTMDAPLLFVGHDFHRTDIRSAAALTRPL